MAAVAQSIEDLQCSAEVPLSRVLATHLMAAFTHM